jgi:hypothetical protein
MTTFEDKMKKVDNEKVKDLSFLASVGGLFLPSSPPTI